VTHIDPLKQKMARCPVAPGQDHCNSIKTATAEKSTPDHDLKRGEFVQIRSGSPRS